MLTAFDGRATDAVTGKFRWNPVHNGGRSSTGALVILGLPLLHPAWDEMLVHITAIPKTLTTLSK